MAAKERLDKLLVARKLAPTRQKAQAMIMAGLVRVDGEPVTKAGHAVAADADVTVAGQEHPYVGRGGVKLEAALRAFELDVTGWDCLDIGASTGGFTDCLLQYGAARVFAVDVGYGQLAWKLRTDPRVVVLERTNIRHLTAEVLGSTVDLAVADLSFIGLAKVLGDAVRFLKPGGWVLGLVKPQFEAGREHVQRGGRVTRDEVHALVLEAVQQAGEAVGLHPVAHIASPITGRKSGNREFLVLWRDGRNGEADTTAPPV